MEVLKTFLEEDFKLWPYNKNSILVAALILGSFKANDNLKKWGGKYYIIYIGIA